MWKIISSFLITILGAFLGLNIYPVFLVLMFIGGAIANDKDRDDQELKNRLKQQT